MTPGACHAPARRGVYGFSLPEGGYGMLPTAELPAPGDEV